MEEGDGEAFYALFALHYFHWAPHIFLELPHKEKAAVMAMIDYKVERMKERR